MKKSDKYSWAEGSIPEIGHHSLIKHKIIYEYVEAYILTVMRNAQIPVLKMSIIDGFCGGGKYINPNGDMVDGSPYQIMYAVNSARVKLNDGRLKERFADIDFYFIDKSKDAITSLNSYMCAESYDRNLSNDIKKTEFICSDFSKQIPYLIDKIKRKKGGERALFILDQYAYSDVPMRHIRNILESTKAAEVILTFNVDSMRPYFSSHDNFRRAIVNADLDKFINWQALGSFSKSRIMAFIQAEVSKAIKLSSGAQYISPFFIKPQNEREWGYWLIHLCNNYKAHEVMKSLHWDNANYFGHELNAGIYEFGYQASKDNDLIGNKLIFTFDEHSRQACINALQDDMGRLIFEHENKTVGEFYESIITKTPGAEEHLNGGLQLLHLDNSIQIFNESGGERRVSKSYNRKDVIVPKRQMFFNFK